MQDNKEFNDIINDPNLIVPEKLIKLLDYCRSIKLEDDKPLEVKDENKNYKKG